MTTRNKTVATWLALAGGRWVCTGLSGLGDLLGWALPIPTALGLYGLERARELAWTTP